MSEPEKIGLLIIVLGTVWFLLSIRENEVRPRKCPVCGRRMESISYGQYDEKRRWVCDRCGYGR